MALVKAVRLEIQILTETTQPDAEIIAWTKEALTKYCEFRCAVVHMTEKVDRIIFAPECEADA